MNDEDKRRAAEAFSQPDRWAPMPPPPLKAVEAAIDAGTTKTVDLLTAILAEERRQTSLLERLVKLQGG